MMFSLTTAVAVLAPSVAQLRIRDSATKVMILRGRTTNERVRERERGRKEGREGMTGRCRQRHTEKGR